MSRQKEPGSLTSVNVLLWNLANLASTNPLEPF